MSSLSGFVQVTYYYLNYFGRGFNEALNGFSSEGWSMRDNDGMDDVTILVNSSPDKLMGLNLSFADEFTSLSNAVLCAKASMLLQVSSANFHPEAIQLNYRLSCFYKWMNN